MKRADVKLGETYLVRVSGRIARVRIERDRGIVRNAFLSASHNGWHTSHDGYEATNLDTGRTITVSAGRLRERPKAGWGQMRGVKMKKQTLTKMEAASNPSLEDLLIERKKQKDQLVALADAFQDLRAAMRETDRVMEEIWKLLPEE